MGHIYADDEPRALSTLKADSVSMGIFHPSYPHGDVTDQ